MNKKQLRELRSKAGKASAAARAKNGYDYRVLSKQGNSARWNAVLRQERGTASK